MGAASLTCDFDGSPHFELVRVTFNHPALEGPLEARRGKWSLYNTFPYSPAVMSLATLILKTAAWQLLGFKGTQPSLEASKAGPISALDYALGREPQWISEIFGVDKSGHPVSRLLFTRENPERKRPGPVRISFKSSFAKECLFKIQLSGSSCNDPKRLIEIAENLAKSPRKIKSKPPPPETTLNSYSLKEFFRTALSTEVSKVLRYTDIFNTQKLNSALKQALEHTALKRITSRHFKLNIVESCGGSSSQRLGSGISHETIRRTLDKVGPIKIGLTPGQSGALFLLTYLQKVRGYPIEPVYHFAHTRDVAQSLNYQNSELLQGGVLSTATAASCLKNGDYSPLMVLPTATHRIIAPANYRVEGKCANQGDFRLLKDFPTSPSFFLDELVSSKWIDLKGSKFTHEEPDITTESLAQGDTDLRAALWFPYDVLNVAFNSCVTVQEKQDSLGYITNILYINNALYNDPHICACLTTAMRDAWLSLLETNSGFDAVFDSITDDSQYLELVTRFSGIKRSALVSAPLNYERN